MARIKIVKIYDVDWILSNGHCYRTTTGCTWEQVKECRKTAKLLGETIKHTYSHSIKYEY
jgi:hypothetical protein